MGQSGSSLPRIPVSLVKAIAPWKRSAGARTVLPDASREVAGWTPDRMKLADFRGVVGSSAPVPVTYPQVPVMALHLDLISALSFPIKVMGVIHLSSVVEVLGELPADEPWEVRAWIGESRHVRSGLEFDLCGEVSVGGTPVWTSRAVNLSRSKAARGAEVSAAPDLAVPNVDEAWGPPTVIPIKEGTGRSFGRVTGDVNPIHMHALPAKAFGFKSAIAHGWWTTARVLAELGADAATPGRQVEIIYRRPVYLPSKPELLVRDLSARDQAGDGSDPAAAAGQRFALVAAGKSEASDGQLPALVYGEVRG